MLSVDSLSGGYGNGFQLNQVSFHVLKGEFFGIIGPNGSGKTTLAKMISGVLPYHEGSIRIATRELNTYRPKELAKKIAVLPQISEHTFEYTVRETVSLGRYAHQTGLFPQLTNEDQQMVDRVMAYTDVMQYSHVPISELSGGEKQRVFLAQALAQEPEIIILDEPTNHLDLNYQKELLDLLKSWTKEKQLTVIAIFHDLNLASLYCDRLLMLHRGQVITCGAPEQVLKHENIYAVYATEVEAQFHPNVPKPQIMLASLPSPEKNALQQAELLEMDDRVIFTAPAPLKTVATHAVGPSVGWYDKFINVYQTNTLSRRLLEDHFTKEKALITISDGEHHGTKCFAQQFCVADVSYYCIVHVAYTLQKKQVSYNIWLFVDGSLSDAAFLQALVTVTEAKTLVNKQFATCQQQESIVIAATQKGAAISECQRNSLHGEQIFQTVTNLMTDAQQHHYVQA